MIGILKLASGNIGSVINIVDYCGGSSKLINNESDFLNLDKIIIPGVGDFDNAMNSLRSKPLILNNLIDFALNKKKPVLGICLGMQILANFSEEGNQKGLGWISGEVKKISSINNTFKIPHMGWNTTTVDFKSKLFDEFEIFDKTKFYHVHSYHFVPTSNKVEIASTNYGEKLITAIEQDNIYGVQFHPEKSHKYGVKLIKNFMKL